MIEKITIKIKALDEMIPLMVKDTIKCLENEDFDLAVASVTVLSQYSAQREKLKELIKDEI